MTEVISAPNKMRNTVNNLRSRMPKAPSLLSGESNGSGRDDEPSSKKDPVQVEPKTFFANERTFIQWISAALLLLTVSSIMMGSGSYNGTSSVIAFSSLVLVGYASFVYFRRVKLLRSGNAYGYLDFLGPSILAAGVGLGVFIVFADAIKGSEFLPFGKGEGKDKDYDDRRFLMSTLASPQVPELHVRPTKNILELQEVDGKCSRYSINGINLLEYQPRDIVLNHKSSEDTTSTNSDSELIVATPQALVSHPLSGRQRQQRKDEASAFLLEIPDTEIQSMTMVGDRLFALSIGPFKTELIEFNASATDDQSYTEINIKSRFLILDSTSTTGSMVFVPSSEEGKLYIYLDGTMHSYQQHLLSNNNESPVLSLSRTGSINMKVLNRGRLLIDSDDDDPITAMEHFEGLTYVLRERQNIIEAWDFNSATLLAEMPLPTVSKNDKWVGMAFQRRINDDEGNEDKSSFHPLRKSKMVAAVADDDERKTNTSVYLHMPLDAFPPQLWSFRLEERDDEKDDDDDEHHSIFSFPECDGKTMN